MALEDSFLYHPARGGRVRGPGSDVQLRASDGTALHGFLVEPPSADLTLLYLHGNAGNLADRSDVLQLFAETGVRVFGLDYRGYGQSEGTPSEAGLYDDARAAYDWLVARYPAGTIVVLGESLGGGPACELASTREVGGLVLLSTFTSVPAMAAHVFPFLPARWLVRTRFDNLAKLSRVRSPTLVVHGRADEIIPFAMGEQLFEAAPEPKVSLFLERSGHNDLYILDGERLQRELRAFFERVRTGA